MSVLQKEIDAELAKNGEGIALEMATKEFNWIEENFGISRKAAIPELLPVSPASPKSPGGGRLAQKLQGLKLGLSVSELGQ